MPNTKNIKKNNTFCKCQVGKNSSNCLKVLVLLFEQEKNTNHYKYNEFIFLKTKKKEKKQRKRHRQRQRGTFSSSLNERKSV